MGTPGVCHQELVLQRWQLCPLSMGTHGNIGNPWCKELFSLAPGFGGDVGAEMGTPSWGGAGSPLARL